MARDRGVVRTREVNHDEQTLFKVYLGLKSVGITGQAAQDVVFAIQAQGILFRELTPISMAEERPEKGEE